jgi:protein translocase SecG subunit
LLAAFYTLLVISVIVALCFVALVILTGKGDAMSGGGGVRTTFKGRATIEDMISRVTLGLGIGFMVIMIILDILSHKIKWQ